VRGAWCLQATVERTGVSGRIPANCLKRVAAVVDQCIKCSHVLHPGDGFCRSCGTPVCAPVQDQAVTAKERAATLALQKQAAENKALREQMEAMQLMEVQRAQSREALERQVAAERQAREQSELQARKAAIEKAAFQRQVNVAAERQARQQIEQQAQILAQRAAVEKAAFQRQVAAERQAREQIEQKSRRDAADKAALEQQLAADKIARKQSEEKAQTAAAEKAALERRHRVLEQKRAADESRRKKAEQIATDARIAEQLRQSPILCVNCGQHYREQDNDAKACVRNGPDIISYHHAKPWQTNIFSKDKYPCCSNTDKYSQGCRKTSSLGFGQVSKHYPASAASAQATPCVTTVDFQFGKTTYQVDLRAMTQTNGITGFERQIRTSASGSWEYEDDNRGSGNWKPYDHLRSAQLSQAHRNMSMAGAMAPAAGQTPPHWQSTGINDGKAKSFAVSAASRLWCWQACLLTGVLPVRASHQPGSWLLGGR